MPAKDARYFFLLVYNFSFNRIFFNKILFPKENKLIPKHPLLKKPIQP